LGKQYRRDSCAVRYGKKRVTFTLTYTIRREIAQARVPRIVTKNCRKGDNPCQEELDLDEMERSFPYLNTIF